jgi:RHS repeat-associated protein
MYFHTDLNGCPEELTDENGKILWECSFQLWGKRIHEIEHEPIEQNLRYQGQYLDRETGLHYNTFRYYDPDIGRFTQPDPIGLLGGLNLYQYAPNGLTWIDPWGWSCGSTTRVRHYTNRKGSNAIKQEGVIKARDNGRVYVEPANKKPLNQIKAEDKYGIKKDRGRDYIETDVPTEKLEWIKNPAYHTEELTIKGDIVLSKNAKIVQRK